MKETMNKPKSGKYTEINAINNNRCERCLSDSKRHRVDFYGRTYCLDCEKYGISTNQTKIYRFERVLEPKIHQLLLPFALSDVQKKGSQFFLNCIQSRKSGYLNAVCGAGKTEMIYETLLYALNHNLRVCITIPRRQVVEELSIRIRSVFPNTCVKELHQDAKNDDFADILISTTQQLIRYFQEFDLLIIDEFDAFPLSGNTLLYRLIKKSLKLDGIVLVMSATIGEEGIEFIKEFNMDTYEIFERFHGEDLDIPKIHLERQLLTKILHHQIPKVISEVLDLWLKERRYLFIYVPTIELGTTLSSLFVEYGYKTRLFTSKTGHKKVELKDFEKRKTDILITTSILERGVTYPNLNVMILWADHRIFTKEMLIQIAGRVGRKKDFPHGEILMISEKKTKAMEDAIKHIKMMNRVKNNHDLCDL